MKVWGEDPHKCPCCPGTMKVIGTMIRRSEVEFFLRLHGLWEAIVALPPPPDPPFDIDTMEPIEVRLARSGGTISRRSDRIGGRKWIPLGPPPNSIWATDAASSWMPPIPSLRSSGRSPGRTEHATHGTNEKNGPVSKLEPSGSGNPSLEGSLFGRFRRTSAKSARKLLTHPAKSADSSERWP